MSFFEKGAVRIHYEEVGSGFPLLLIAGGGLNSNIARITGDYPPFNAMRSSATSTAASPTICVTRRPANPQARLR